MFIDRYFYVDSMVTVSTLNHHQSIFNGVHWVIIAILRLSREVVLQRNSVLPYMDWQLRFLIIEPKNGIKQMNIRIQPVTGS